MYNYFKSVNFIFIFPHIILLPLFLHSCSYILNPKYSPNFIKLLPYSRPKNCIVLGSRNSTILIMSFWVITPFSMLSPFFVLSFSQIQRSSTNQQRRNQLHCVKPTPTILFIANHRQLVGRLPLHFTSHCWVPINKVQQK